MASDPRVVRVFLSRQPSLFNGTTTASRERDFTLAKPVSVKALRQLILEALGKAAKVTPDNVETPRSGQASGQASNHGSRARILLVEDNPVNQLVGESMLDSIGFQVCMVADGRAAIARLSTERFDAVLMDCQMPGMDGFEATRAIRRAELGQDHLPIIGLSAHASSESRDACLLAGMDDFLSKPYTRDELGSALSRWIGAMQPA